MLAAKTGFSCLAFLSFSSATAHFISQLYRSLRITNVLALLTVLYWNILLFFNQSQRQSRLVTFLLRAWVKVARAPVLRTLLHTWFNALPDRILLWWFLDCDHLFLVEISGNICRFLDWLDWSRWSGEDVSTFSASWTAVNSKARFIKRALLWVGWACFGP